MKSFFLSIIAALGSFFGIHSHSSLVQPVSSTANIPVISTSVQSTSTIAVSAQPVAVQPNRPTPTAVVSTPIIPPNITFPLGGDVLHPGQTYAVRWQNKDPRAINYSLNLEYVVANRYYYAVLPLGIVSSTAQTLSFKVPSSGLSSSTNYQIYFSNAANKSDVIVGSQAFRIK